VTPRRRLLLLAFVSALLAAAAFPPLDLGLLAWIAWAPWLAGLALAPTWRDAAWSGALHSMVLHSAQCLWMVHVMRAHGGLAWPAALGMYAFGLLTVAPYGIVVALAGAAIARRRGTLALPAIALVSALVDVARCHLTLGHPWLIPGMTQAGHPVAMGAADVAGVHGLGAVVLLGNAAVAALALLLLRKEPRRRALVTAGACATVVAVSLVHGALAAREHGAPQAWALAVELGEQLPSSVPWPEEGIRVAVVQGSQPQEVKVRSTPEDDLALARVQLDLQQQALRHGAQSIAWAESAHPGTTRRLPWLVPSIQGQLRQAQPRVIRPEAIVGALVEEPPAGPREARGWAVTNSALLIDVGGRAGRYDKRRLVPFGEYLPWRPVFGWFPQIVRLIGEMKPGTSDDPLPGAHAAYGAIVCYEIVLPQRVRDVTRAGADVIVNLTNDGWYHGTWMPEQHLRFAILRAVETRRFVLRAANSGISAIVAPDGRVVGRLDEGRRGLLLGPIERRDAVTAYVRWGDVPVVVLGLLATAWALGEALATRRAAVGSAA
jgi:apolipoprotein N-acyltransferase